MERRRASLAGAQAYSAALDVDRRAVLVRFTKEGRRTALFAASNALMPEGRQRQRANPQLIRIETLRSTAGLVHDRGTTLTVVFHQVGRSAAGQIDCGVRAEAEHDIRGLHRSGAHAVTGL